MKTIFKTVSWASLLLILVPPFLYMGDAIGSDLLKTLMAAGTVVWFVTAAAWMWNSE